MADRVTCCPHCSTSFRITAAQLQTARGAVRCGSCLQIFRATDHLVPLPEIAPVPVSPPTATPARREPDPDHGNEFGRMDHAAADDLTDDFDLDSANEPRLSDDFDEPHLAEEVGAKETATAEFTADEFTTEEFAEEDAAILPEADQQTPAAASALPEDDPFADDTATKETLPVTSLFDDSLNPDHPEEYDFELNLDEDALISDDMDLDDQSHRLSLGELSEDFLDLDAGKPVKSSLFDRELKIKEVENDHSDESWAEELLQEIETEQTALEPSAPDRKSVV